MRNRRAAAVVAIVVAVIGAAPFAQSPGQSARPSVQSAVDDKHSGVVMGVVVDSANDRPIPNALVVLGSNALVANGDGRFAFTDLAHGSYALLASKGGYFDGAYGRQRPNGPSRALELAVDERLGDIKLVLWKHSTISGTVTDERGEPMADVRVEVLSRVSRAGRRLLVRAGGASTDDRGIYRIGELLPGEQLVTALPYGLPPTEAGAFAYPALFFPGAPLIDQAAPVTLRIGENRTATDLQMHLARALRVSGTVRGPMGPVAAALSLVSSANDSTAMPEAEVSTARSGPDGRFSFPAVTPGAYSLRAILDPSQTQTDPSVFPRLMWAAVPVVVNATDIAGVDVTLRSAFRVFGRVEYETANGKKASIGPRRLEGFIQSATGEPIPGSAPAAFAVSSGNQFTTRELLPGRYVIGISNLPDAWTLKRISVSGRDVTHVSLSVNGDVYPVLTLTDTPAELSGVVRRGDRPDPAATVMLFPANSDLWSDAASTGAGVREVRAGRDGSYRFPGLPPGDYCVLAREDDDPGSWKDTQTFEALARVASRVSIADAEKRSLDLTLAVIR